MRRLSARALPRQCDQRRSHYKNDSKERDDSCQLPVARYGVSSRERRRLPRWRSSFLATGNSSGAFGGEQAVRAVAAAVDDVDLGFFGIVEKIEVVTEEFHLLDRLLGIHRF